MQRKYKFRAKHIDNGSIFVKHDLSDKWVYGYLEEEDYMYACGIGDLFVDKNTVSEYIGETKSGQEVYLGDIVKSGEHIGEVVFEKFKYKVKWHDDHWLRRDLHYWMTHADIEVIGNIWDTTQILGKE